MSLWIANLIPQFIIFISPEIYCSEAERNSVPCVIFIAWLFMLT
jgi:hypothetical protein